jgi:heptosyltransferase III
VTSPRTVVILHPGGLGDLLLAVPAIYSLKTRYPTHKVLLCGHEEGSRFLAECGLVDCSLSVETTACTALFAGQRPDDPSLLDWLGCCDYAVAWTGDESGILAAALKHCGAAIAVVQSPFACTLTAVHQAERYAEAVGIEATAVPMPHLAVPHMLKNEAWKYLALCGVSPKHPLIVVHPGSGSRHKCVKPEILVPVLKALEAEGLQPLVLQGPADDEMVGQLLPRMSPCPTLLRGLPLPLLGGVLSHAELFLGHDSGVTHLAALLGTSTVVLFGPTDPARWAPRGAAVTVSKEKPCVCPSWEAVRRCEDKPCLDVSSSTILRACLTARATALNPRIC